MKSIQPRPVGQMLREWRLRRRLSQLDLACEAEISTRHLSFVETGRSWPSREMVLKLAERLEVPLRERNVLLTGAGFAPVFRERPLTDPALKPAREALDLVLAGHEPYPALAIDRHWMLVATNNAVKRLLAGVDASLLAPPVNVLRLSLHPAGLAPRIANYQEWRSHLLARLQQQIRLTADPVSVELLKELRSYPPPAAHFQALPENVDDLAGIVVPFQLLSEAGVLCFVSTTTVFGTPVEVTLSELALESFFPADTRTAEILRCFAQETNQFSSKDATRVEGIKSGRRFP
jgi:transcriptional regulator with XRE-family HTH domain